MVQKQFKPVMKTAFNNCHQRTGIAAVGELTNGLPGIEAKFITKSRSLELLPGRILSAG